MERLPDEFDAIPQGVFDTIPVVSLMGSRRSHAFTRLSGDCVKAFIVNRVAGGAFQVFVANVDHKGEVVASDTAKLPSHARLKHLCEVTAELPTAISLRVARVIGWE
jgi:hypothetical protein